VTHSINRSSLVIDSLRARVTAEKDLVMHKKCVFKYTYLSFVENFVTPVSGVLCDLLRTRVTAEKDSVMVKIAKVRLGRFKSLNLTSVENLDTPRVKSSVCFTTTRTRLQSFRWSSTVRESGFVSLISHL